MVREMMDDEGGHNKPQATQEAGGPVAPQVKGQVVHGDRATTYIGATHCLAMLEDVSDENECRWFNRALLVRLNYGAD